MRMAFVGCVVGVSWGGLTPVLAPPGVKLRPAPKKDIFRLRYLKDVRTELVPSGEKLL